MQAGLHNDLKASLGYSETLFQKKKKKIKIQKRKKCNRTFLSISENYISSSLLCFRNVQVYCFSKWLAWRETICVIFTWFGAFISVFLLSSEMARQLLTFSRTLGVQMS